jgi:hypothetical protein
MQPRKKVVSRAQYRYFTVALERLQEGKPVGLDMTEEELFAALQGVDYDSLPERAGKAAPKRQAQPTPRGKFITLQETIEKARAQVTPPLPPVCTHDEALIIALDDYLDQHPKHPLNADAKVRKAVTGGLLVQVEPGELPHMLLRTKPGVKAVLKADPRFECSRLWSMMEAQGFLAAFGVSVKSLEDSARAMAHCPTCAGPREESLHMQRRTARP